MKIKYEFVTGEVLEIEVDEELGGTIVEIERQEYNRNRSETRRHSSIPELEERGYQFPDEEMNILLLFEQQENCEILHKALLNLLPQQQELIQKVFFYGESIVSVAIHEGVGEAAIRDRLRKIYRKLKNISY